MRDAESCYQWREEKCVPHDRRACKRKPGEGSGKLSFSSQLVKRNYQDKFLGNAKKKSTVSAARIKRKLCPSS